MSQTAIPYLFMRGGTSRGPYFNRHDLPEDLEDLSKLLVSVVGSGHPLNIDGIGGGAAVTTKVAMLSRSGDDWADIDYFFAQISVEDCLVDYKPTCGNILSAVGPAALEMGLVEAGGDETEVKIRAVNTGARIVATVQTPDGVNYEGDAQVDGVPGSAAPVALQFMDTVGGITGAMFPTGKPLDVIDGISVSCMDVAMPMVIAKAVDFGLTGYESKAELDGNAAFFAQMEALRLKAGRAMGMGDVRTSVTPKFGLLAPARDGGAVAARYFMPWRTHPAMAVTGAQCLAACLLAPGTIGAGMAPAPATRPAVMTLEHPSGKLDVLVDHEVDDTGLQLHSAGLIRTARKLASGSVFVPTSVWAG